ncbi:MAG: peptide chain release factor N(5)-glutamine methyltransferase [Chlorobiaceae bacterium]|nr:peptide chain release factor N(5)-glutamine methyltransferase [Chlorobiaceae bacterium]
MQELKDWRVVELLKTATGYFEEKKVDEPRISSELLLGHVLGQSRLQLYLHHNRPVYPDELDRFRVLCRQRLDGRPVQYIIGEQYFYGLKFTVDERVLIPRPETELLVEHVLECLGMTGRGGSSEAKILDIGTGSGCIAVSIAKICPLLRVTAVDCSLDALEVARMNAAGNDVESRIAFIAADMFSESFAASLPEYTYDLIVSNPPYIPEAEWLGLQREVRKYEPRIALTTPQGIECYEAVITKAAKLLVPGGKICFELHADAAATVSELMTVQGFTGITVSRDYSGLDRVISGIIPIGN